MPKRGEQVQEKCMFIHFCGFGLGIPLLLKVRFHVDDPAGPDVQSYADKYLEVNVEGEWGLVCFEPLTRNNLNVLCRDLEGKFGLRSSSNTPRYYGSMRRLVDRHCTVPMSYKVPYKRQESVHLCVHSSISYFREFFLVRVTLTVALVCPMHLQLRGMDRMQR